MRDQASGIDKNKVVMKRDYENINTPKITENDSVDNWNNNAGNRLDNIAINDVLTDNNIVVDNPVYQRSNWK